jgi:hypothetical protein
MLEVINFYGIETIVSYFYSQLVRCQTTGTNFSILQLVSEINSEFRQQLGRTNLPIFKHSKDESSIWDSEEVGGGCFKK